jgi:hypothetical protein
MNVVLVANHATMANALHALRVTNRVIRTNHNLVAKNVLVCKSTP